MNRLKVGDLVQVISGKDKGKKGKITKILVDDDTVLLAEHARDLARLALVGAADDDDGVTLANPRGHHSTSGASEMIFMNFFARSSRATGPKMRVPMGSRSLLMRTALFSSKRM